MVVLSLVGCVHSATPASPGGPPATTHAVRVASFDFPESEVLAEIYGQTLRAHGVAVDRELDLGARELVMPALIRGLVDIVPEYTGAALEFLDGGTGLAVPDPKATYALLRRRLASNGLTALHAAPAQDQNALAVTRATADRLGLHAISDLRGRAADLTLGGPPECPARPLCLLGLRRTYGLRFRNFVPFGDTATTASALRDGAIDVGVLFSTDGTIRRDQLVPLADDRGLQPADNVVPVLRSVTLRAIGTDVAARLDDVSSHLTTSVLRSLNARVAAGESPADVAARWLRGIAAASATPTHGG
jgi:osmoprotectant transport system substrate-binding protein